uniref:Uncharacterized protein n=1 Tax=Glossina austeni TaxID=7395 RepID=A0A1A9VT42_GLOAU
MAIIKSFANSLLTIEVISIVLIIKNDYIIVSLKLPYKLNVFLSEINNTFFWHFEYLLSKIINSVQDFIAKRNELPGNQHMSIEPKAILYAVTEQRTARLKEQHIY